MKKLKIKPLKLLKSKSVLYADYEINPLVRPAEQELEKKLNEVIKKINEL